MFVSEGEYPFEVDKWRIEQSDHMFTNMPSCR